MKAVENLLRVWRVTKKPSKKEFFSIVKIVAVGFLIIGLIGFIMEMLWQLLLKHLF
jgi:protein translocase SEC61 complex gamma subunit